MDHSPAFVHAPLEDATSQIRLLRFIGRGSDGSLLFDMGHYHLSDSTASEKRENRYLPRVPEYIALSYTWGTPIENHEIFIKGKRFEVGANCHYALSQAVKIEESLALEQHYWIDQVCIQQKDVDEKGKQVGNMGEVYRRASTVFACVGPHADDSDLLFNFIHSLDLVEFTRIFRHVNAGYEPPSEAARKQEVLRLSLLYQDNPDPDLGALNPIFDAFGQRAYWKRL